MKIKSPTIQTETLLQLGAMEAILLEVQTDIKFGFETAVTPEDFDYIVQSMILVMNKGIKYSENVLEVMESVHSLGKDLSNTWNSYVPEFYWFRGINRRKCAKCDSHLCPSVIK